jgi:putative nucleotidyltransferase with HDIG domain
MADGSSLGERFGSLRHLAGRFFGAVSPGGPPPGDDDWARSLLLEGERDLWRRMSGPDRRHAVAVARESQRLLEQAGLQARRDVLAAALLHDVGKVEARLGTLARVAVTLAALVFGHDRLAGAGGSSGRGWLAPARRYLAHDRIGAKLLRDCGSEEFTIAWAEQHHLPPERWSVDPRIGWLLKAADGG